MGAAGQVINFWVLSIAPEELGRHLGDYPREMEQHFPIIPGQPRGMALTIFYSFPKFPT